MTYDDDPFVVEWFKRALADARPGVRLQAARLLVEVRFPGSDSIVRVAQNDADPAVAKAAMFAHTVFAEAEGEMDLLESDLAQGLADSDLEWQWEYALKVCLSDYVPSVCRLVWTGEEDDSTAKRLAMMKAFPSGDPPLGSVAVIISKRLVTKYTRSPRNQIEAMAWHQKGRPRYQDPE